jgi:hypothetical protein
MWKDSKHAYPTPTLIASCCTPLLRNPPTPQVISNTPALHYHGLFFLPSPYLLPWQPNPRALKAHIATPTPRAVPQPMGSLERSLLIAMVR